MMVATDKKKIQGSVRCIFWRLHIPMTIGNTPALETIPATPLFAQREGIVLDSKMVVDFLASRIAACEAIMKKHWASWNSTRITFVMRSCWVK